MKYGTILFDADGTLYDFDASEKLSLRESLEFAGIPCDRETIAIYHEINDREWKALERGETTRERLKVERFAKLISALEAKNVTVRRSAREIADFYLNALAEKSILFPESEALCRRLYADFELYIVTNGTTSVQKSRFARSPITKYIKKAFISDEMGHDKPAIEYFNIVFDELGITDENKHRVLLVGDSLSSDIKGGINAGLDTCWFNPNEKDSGDVSPLYMIKSLNELYEICYSGEKS